MPDTVKPGDWVRVHIAILSAGQRAPGVPSDTASHAYEGWINGWAVEEGQIGQPMTIRTMAGRLVQGTLVEVHPGYHHGFGRPHRALLIVGSSLRALLEDGRQ